RIVAKLGLSIERIGAARSSRYAMRRPVRNFGSEWPVYRISDSGRPQTWGTLRTLHNGFRFLPAESAPMWVERLTADGLFQGLPFFLQDLPPQGYLGRAIGREIAPRLGVPPDIRLWSDDDVLAYFLTDGYDLPGDLIVGDHAMERAVRAAENLTPVADSDRDRVYPERAVAAQRGEIAGSSAGGEQPKFLAAGRREGEAIRSVLVKFSAADPSPVSVRWADLLACEHLAAEMIRDRHIACARTEMIDAGDRRFLELDRGGSAVGTSAPDQPRRRPGASLDLLPWRADRKHRHAPRERFLLVHRCAALPFGSVLRHPAHALRAGRAGRPERTHLCAAAARGQRHEPMERRGGGRAGILGTGQHGQTSCHAFPGNRQGQSRRREPDAPSVWLIPGSLVPL